jgi:hypothetical protein
MSGDLAYQNHKGRNAKTLRREKIKEKKLEYQQEQRRILSLFNKLGMLSNEEKMKQINSALEGENHG